MTADTSRPVAWINRRGYLLSHDPATYDCEHETWEPLFRHPPGDEIDCRTCRHYSGHGACLSVLRCVGGSGYQRGGVVRLWEAKD